MSRSFIMIRIVYILYCVCEGYSTCCFQIRAINNFTLPGDWSDPVLVLNKTGVALDNTDGNPNRSPAGGMVWVFVLVVVVFIILVVILIILFVCVYRKFCIHRRIKYVSFSPPSSSPLLFYSTHAHTHSLTLTHLLTYSLIYPLTHSHTHSYTHTFTHSRTLIYSLTHICTHTLTLSHIHVHINNCTGRSHDVGAYANEWRLPTSSLYTSMSSTCIVP